MDTWLLKCFCKEAVDQKYINYISINKQQENGRDDTCPTPSISSLLTTLNNDEKNNDDAIRSDKILSFSKKKSRCFVI